MRLLTFVVPLVAGVSNFSYDQSNMETMRHMKSHAEHAHEYACPMHPEVKGNEGEKCPKCGMNLEKINSKAEVFMSLETSPNQIEALQEVELALTPKDKSDNTAIVELQETHEKMIHVIVVNENLTWLDHIHAEPDNNGAYKVSETFPSAGKYFVYADYKSTIGGLQTDRIEVKVTGKQNTAQHHHQEKTTSETDGYSLSIQNGNDLKTGRVELPIMLEKKGSKVERSDIENYLGAVAHIILIGQEDKDFIHIHPESSETSPIHAHAEITKPGVYRMWVQFQTNGKVNTADFTLNLEQGTEKTEGSHNHSHVGHMHQYER